MFLRRVVCSKKWGPKTARAHAKKTKQKTTSQMPGHWMLATLSSDLNDMHQISPPDLMPSYSKGDSPASPWSERRWRPARVALQPTEADERSGQGHDRAHALAFTPTYTGEEDGAKRTWAGWRTFHATRHSNGHPTSIRPSSHTAHWRRDPGSLAGRRPVASNLAREGDPGPRSTGTRRRRACCHHLWHLLWHHL